jgi:hypothetical protein
MAELVGNGDVVEVLGDGGKEDEGCRCFFTFDFRRGLFFVEGEAEGEWDWYCSFFGPVGFCFGAFLTTPCFGEECSAVCGLLGERVGDLLTRGDTSLTPSLECLYE